MSLQRVMPFKSPLVEQKNVALKNRAGVIGRSHRMGGRGKNVQEGISSAKLWLSTHYEEYRGVSILFLKTKE